jgi:hypothetical protein
MDTKHSDQTPSLPWYKEGLRFKCTGCGKCCTGAPGYVWVTEPEIEGMAGALGIATTDFKRKYIRRRDNRLSLIETKVGPNEYACVFLKDKKCQVYQNRPIQCRTFPWWPSSLKSEESWNQTAIECEGISADAPLHTYDAIVNFVKSEGGEI